jgi:hypothetical protein
MRNTIHDCACYSLQATREPRFEEICETGRGGDHRREIRRPPFLVDSPPPQTENKHAILNCLSVYLHQKRIIYPVEYLNVGFGGAASAG